MLRYRRCCVRPKRVRRWPHAHRHVLVRAVIPALELRDLVLPRKRPRSPDRHHRALGARVREPHRLQRRHTLAQVLRKPHLRFSRPAERVPPLRLLLQRGDDIRVRVSHDVRGRVDHEVEVAVAINVIDMMPLRVVNESRVGREVRRAPRAPARQVLRRLIL